MSQRQTLDGSHGFAVGRGLMTAAETLNFNVVEVQSRTYGSNQQFSGMMSLSGRDGQHTDSQRRTHRSSNQVGNTLKLIASLGLSPSDLDVLAQIPDENITVETLPHLLKQLKNRKADQVSSSYVSSDLPPRSFPSEPSFRGSRNEWESMQGGRMDWSSANTSQTRSSQGDYGYSPSQDVSSRAYDSLDYGSSSRNTMYSELSSDPYQSQDMSSSFGSDGLFMQRRVGAPSNGKIQDFLGAMPLMFPHVCALCDFDVHSSMEWTQHVSGMRHAENCRVLLDLYPDWDPYMSSVQMSGSLNFPNDPLYPDSFSDVRQKTGMSYSYGSESDLAYKNEALYSAAQQNKGKVVVLLYTQKPKLDDIFRLAAAFGRIHESLVLDKKAFLEFETHEEAVAMADYFKRSTVLNGIRVNVYFSKKLLAIERRDLKRSSDSTCVVFFSNIPKQTKEKGELLAIARRFGSVVKHLFLSNRAFVQMSNWKAAENMVKYYNAHPLIIGQQFIQLRLSKHKTLNVDLGKGRQIKRAEDDKISSGGKSSSTTSEKKAEGKTVVATTRNDKEKKNVETHDVNKKETKAEKEMTADKSTIIKNESTVEDRGFAKGKKEPNKVSEKKPASEEQAQNQDGSNKLEGTKEQDDHDEAAPGVSAKQEKPEDTDVSVNTEEFVSLDEQDDEKAKPNSSGNSKEKEDIKVVNVVGFHGSHGFFNDILALAKPFGKVVKHLVVRTKGVAFLELESEKAARAMTSFYNGNVIPSVCGKRVQIQLSKNYSTLQDGSVIRFANLPSCESVELSVLKLAAQHGKIKRYLYVPGRTECFVEMEKNEDAVNLVKAGKPNLHMIENKKVQVHISKKYRVLIHGLKPPSLEEDKKTSKREFPNNEEQSKKSLLPKTNDEEPQNKKLKKPSVPETSSVAKEKKEKEAVKQEPEEQKIKDTKEKSKDPTEEDNRGGNQKPEPNKLVIQEVNEQMAETLKIPETTLENLGPYDPNVPVGLDLLKTGFYCKLCFQFYSSEDAAKRVHCCSEAHYDKLKKNVEKKKL